jgi:FkbM family methyltransferase
VHAQVLGRGVVFCVNMENDPIQRNHRKGTFYELKELMDLQPIFPAGGVFVDIGANVGNHTLFAALHLAAGRVIPFEPNRQAYDLLIQNVLVNGLRDVVDLGFLGVGLSDRHDGGFQMEERKRNLGGARMLAGQGELEVYRADDILADVTPDMIKIDVEAMEMQVLNGLSGVLDRCRPILLVEVDNENEAAFGDWMNDNGYDLVSTHQRYRTNKNHIIADRAQSGALKQKLAA